jgi:hypothetical protein
MPDMSDKTPPPEPGTREAGKRTDDGDRPPDLTIDPADPEPRIADLDHPTDAELLAVSLWHHRNAEALFRRGVECYIDDGSPTLTLGRVNRTGSGSPIGVHGRPSDALAYRG